MQINQYIDHTLLKANATENEIKTLCQEAMTFEFKAVCVNPSFVPLAKRLLKNSKVLTCTVIGFPLGANSTSVKLFETREALDQGADEIDMVINISALKDGKYDYIQNEIKTLADCTHSYGKILKVIIETSLLTNEEKNIVTHFTLNAGADFIKTSTGFSTGGATISDVELMKKIAGDKMQIKASGGVRDLKTAMAMIEAGATRLGTSSGVKLVQGEKIYSGY